MASAPSSGTCERAMEVHRKIDESSKAALILGFTAPKHPHQKDCLALYTG
jgi:hypothetical protein